MDSKSKWNNKYKDRLNDHVHQAPNERLKSLSSYLKGGLALDLACGLGANSFFLADLNYQVQAFDISDIAIDFVTEQVNKQELTVHPRLCDLTELSKLHIENQSLDLVVITYYLDRLTFPFVKSIIKENGYFFMETFYTSPLNEEQRISDQFKLKPQELLSEFKDWHVLFYEENEQEGRQTIFARKNLNINL